MMSRTLEIVFVGNESLAAPPETNVLIGILVPELT